MHAVVMGTSQDPVTTPEGYIYSKESILECLVSQKKTIARQLAAWEEQEASRAAEVCPSLALHPPPMKQLHISVARPTAPSLSFEARGVRA